MSHDISLDKEQTRQEVASCQLFQSAQLGRWAT
jgi:hypothetical protein